MSTPKTGWIETGLDDVEHLFNLLQDSYDRCPQDRHEARRLLDDAQRHITEKLEGHYPCSFSKTAKVLRRLGREVSSSDDIDAAYLRVQRALNRSIRECTRSELGDLI